MTKKTAVDRLMSIYGAEEKWRGFFERTVEEMNGEGEVVGEETFDNIRRHIARMT